MKNFLSVVEGFQDLCLYAIDNGAKFPSVPNIIVISGSMGGVTGDRAESTKRQDGQHLHVENGERAFLRVSQHE